MRTLFILFLSVCLATAMQAQDSRDLYLTKSLSSENIKNVEVTTSGGNITVEDSDAGQSKVEVYVRSGNGRSLSKEEIKERLEEDYDLEVSVSGSKLIAAARSKSNLNWKNSLSISFKIYVPGTISSHLRTSGGSIHLKGLSGNQDFATSGGSLHLDKLNGSINGRTSGGSIHVFNSGDLLDLRTSGGSIEAGNCRGNITLATSGGSIRLDQLEGAVEATTSGGSIDGNSVKGTLLAHTSGGSIELEGISGSLDASTSGGRVVAELIALGDYVKLSTSAGGIDLSLPSGTGMNLDLRANKINTGTLNDFKGTVEEDRIEGQLGGGGIPVELRASSGNINLDWK
ncbi:DUF4097 and DUF4098 domain-containing protein YvlB [Anseongella ginsenosidimutans]|uniref:DUF4097 and DUF4098 domain-containing protein YvlB n=1 Tax=Anseongella ginsenosidimutans TaxID=496056 RepID=A0A4R3KQ27_9SPHI|nr:DUF4097 family beta strand repeat-containing protein [Anseongella ginsenosidimutans]QEC52639.1 DUF4097 domain-containing protein [Anseongella ginsenosidimutans]TCS86564.1 DUF4097 and DUF4098 domain-containing protein YvlB [Anseongella ginsenosidimutans]